MGFFYISVQVRMGFLKAAGQDGVLIYSWSEIVMYGGSSHNLTIIELLNQIRYGEV